MTDTDYRPEAILDQAAGSTAGVWLNFKSIADRNSFRTRLYKALGKSAEASGGQPGPWDDLVIRAETVLAARLWIGPPSADGFGITGMEEK